MDKNSKKEAVNNLDKTTNNNWSFWFYVIIIFALVVYLGITYINFSEAKDYREKIISNQNESLSLVKQKIGAIYKLDSVIAISQTWPDTTKSDSLKSNRDSLLYINYIISHREELKRSSDALKQELDATAKDTKSMIDIHLQYIDQQYSTLSLWAGIITIVFLIFSFYAVFKQEDALNKAYAIIADLNNKLLGLDESVKSKMEKIEEDSESLINNIDRKAAQEIEVLSKNSTILIENIKNKAEAETRNIIAEADKQRKISQFTSEAEAYRTDEKYDLALQKINDAIKINENDDYLYYRKGLILNDLKKYNLAIECFKKAISQNDNEPGYYFFLGYSYCYNAEYDLAIDNFLIATDRDIKDSLNFTGLGYAYYLNESYDLAIKNFQIAANLNSQYITNYYYLGITYQKLKNYELSLTYFNKAIEINNFHFESIVSIADIYSNLNNIDFALDYYLRAIKIKNNAYSHHCLGNLYLKKMEYQTSINAYTNAIELEESSTVYRDRAKVYSIINNNVSAIADYRKVLEIDPEDSFAKSELIRLTNNM